MAVRIWVMQAAGSAIDRNQPICDGRRWSSVASPVLSDVELMLKAARGETGAFAELYDRHAPTLLALAQRLLPRSDEALDLLHDVFLEAWQHVREYDPARAVPRTWLIIRLRSRALDRKARAARGANIAEQLEAVPALRAHSSLSMPMQTDRQLEVSRALSDLDYDVRRVLELTYFDGMTALEISERDGTAVGTVRSRLARGLEQLRRVLDVKQGADRGN